MAIKAKKLGSKKGIKQSLASGGGKFAQRVPEEGIEVRFLTEPEEWYAVEIHFGNDESFPCTGIDDGCLGCEDGFDKSNKWYANVYWPSEDRVVIFEMGKSVITAILKKYDRNNTIMDRNFEVTKSGAGMQTRYEVEALDVQHIKGLDKMDLIDMDQFFEDWLARFNSESGAEEVVSARGRRTTTKSKKRRAPVEEDDIEDDDDDYDDDDVEDEKPVARKRSVKKSATSKAPAKRRPRRR